MLLSDGEGLWGAPFPTAATATDDECKGTSYVLPVLQVADLSIGRVWSQHLSGGDTNLILKEKSSRGNRTPLFSSCLLVEFFLGKQACNLSEIFQQYHRSLSVQISPFWLENQSNLGFEIYVLPFSYLKTNKQNREEFI